MTKLTIPITLKNAIRAMGDRPYREWLGAVFSGLLFVAVFAFAYSRIAPSDYQVRDDGVITMSHVRNLVDFGTIGVNPSGERVEAFSAPLQFLLYLVAYGLAGVTFKTFFIFQTYISAFLIGAFFHLFLLLLECHKALKQFVLSACVAAFLTGTFSFLAWHGSGMENPITNALFFIALYLCARMLSDSNLRYWYAPIVFLAAISRVEAIYHIGPLVLLFAALWAYRHHTAAGFKFFFVFIAIWGLFNLLRYTYFGDLFPNTAAANNVFVYKRILKILTLDIEMFKDAFATAFQAFGKLHGFVLVALYLLIWITRMPRKMIEIAMLISIIIFTSFMSYLIFGKPRLDVSRPISFLPLFIAMLATVIVTQFKTPDKTASGGVVILASVLIAHLFGGNAPYKLCCETRNFNRMRQVFKAIGSTQKLYRPTVACPDLGIISWYKQFNIVDLGWLGSPVLATLKENRDSKLLSDYLLDFSQPDLFYFHGGWKKVHRRILADKRFKSRYERAKKTGKMGFHVDWRNIWIRKDIKLSSTAKERVLIDQLKKRISKAPIAKALEECSHEPARHACLYVTRTSYRFLFELDSAGILDDIKPLFAKSKTSVYDLAVLNSRNDGTWYKQAVTALAQYRAVSKRQKTGL